MEVDSFKVSGLYSPRLPDPGIIFLCLCGPWFQFSSCWWSGPSSTLSFAGLDSQCSPGMDLSLLLQHWDHRYTLPYPGYPVGTDVLQFTNSSTNWAAAPMHILLLTPYHYRCCFTLQSLRSPFIFYYRIPPNISYILDLSHDSCLSEAVISSPSFLKDSLASLQYLCLTYVLFVFIQLFSISAGSVLFSKLLMGLLMRKLLAMLCGGLWLYCSVAYSGFTFCMVHSVRQ